MISKEFFSRLAVPAILALFLLALYGPQLDHPPVFDSAAWFSIDNIIEIGQERDADRLLSEQLVYWLYQGFDGRLSYLRLAALVLHGLVAYLVYLLFRRLLEDLDPAVDAGAAAFLTALALALHPVSVYAVSYIGQLELVLAAVFTLLFLLSFRAALRGERPWLFALAGIFYLAAMLSKETALMAPGVAAALALLYHRLSFALCRRLAWPFALYGVIAVYFVIDNSQVAGSPYEPSMLLLAPDALETHMGGLEDLHIRSVVSQCFYFFRYLLILAIPNPQWMAIDLQLPFAAAPDAWPFVAGPLCFLLTAVASLLLLLRGGRPALIGFALAWPGIFFLLELSTVRVAEIFVLYRAYLWAPGFLLGLVLLVSWLAGRWARPLLAIAVLLLILPSLDRLQTFTSVAAIWDDSLQKNRPWEGRALFTFRAYTNRGFARDVGGDALGALEDYDRALALVPELAIVHLNRGVALLDLRRFEAALADFDLALKLGVHYAEPTRAKMHAGRAAALERLGRPAEAAAARSEAARLDPERFSSGT